jgi:hypothetical protein
MSKIQINELSSNASEFITLNNRETSEVLGGYSYHYSYPGFSLNFRSYYSAKVAVLGQSNSNSNTQIALGIHDYYFKSLGKRSGNRNSSSHTNHVTVYQS